MPSATAHQLFRFCQLDFSFPLGPADGRYISREPEGVPDVIIFRTLGAPRRSLMRGRRLKRVQQGATEPDPVPVSRVSVIDSAGFEDDAAAGEWLDRCRREPGERERAILRALMVTNRAVHAHRISAADPYRHELAREHVHAVRLGYGEGDDVAEGHWRVAYNVPAERVRAGRRQMLAPQEQLAAILSGRTSTYPSEDLALRARLDIEQGRLRQAALQLRATLDSYAAEASAAGGGTELGQGLAAAKAEARRLAELALEGRLRDGDAPALAKLLEQIERPLRKRRHGGG